MRSGTSGSRSPQYTCRRADRSSPRIYSALHGEKIVPSKHNEIRMYSSSMRTVRCSGRLSCHAPPPLATHVSLCNARPLPCMPHAVHTPLPRTPPLHMPSGHACPPAMHGMPPPPATHALLLRLPAKCSICAGKCSICLYSRFYDTHLPHRNLFSASISLYHQVAPLCLPGSSGSFLYTGQTGDI